VNPVPEQTARDYLESALTLGLLLLLLGALSLVGLRFYVDRGLADVPTFLWVVVADSPVATLLGALSLATLVPHVGRPLSDLPESTLSVYLYTITFVWLVKVGLWTVVALNIGFGAYFPDLVGYWAVVLSHLGFLAIAFLLPHLSRTHPRALLLALALALVNDLLDYGFGLHPPLRYEPALLLPAATVLVSLLSVGLAWQAFPRQRGGETGQSTRS
jgi:uncharacterized membrane protein YpjA